MDIAKLRARLQALRNMTMENGCTEAEALLAAERAAALLAANDLDECALEAPEYDDLSIDVGGRRSALDDIWIAVAIFSNCEGYLSRYGTRWRYVYFGRSSDILIAEYVHEVIQRAATHATALFRETDTYRRRRTAKTRSQATKAFQEGFARSIRNKLFDGLWRRLGVKPAGNAQALIEAHRAPVKAELEKRGVALRSLKPVGAAEGKFRDAAKHDGYRAGRNVTVDAPLSSSPSAAPLLLGVGGD